MTKRGKVLRDTNAGQGLLMIEGEQYRFSREAWKSAEAPGTGLTVDVELDARGDVCAITVVPEFQLAQEQTAAAGRKERLTLTSRLASIGMPCLLASTLLAAAWLVPTTISIQVPFPGKLEFTFWQTLGFLNSSRVTEILEGRVEADAGLYGIAAAIALAGPFLSHFWKPKRAFLGGVLPLAFMIVAGIIMRSHLQHALGSGGESIYSGTSKQVSLGLGAYISIPVSLYLPFISAKSWMAARVSKNQPLNSPQRKAA